MVKALAEMKFLYIRVKELPWFMNALCYKIKSLTKSQY